MRVIYKHVLSATLYEALFIYCEGTSHFVFCSYQTRLSLIAGVFFVPHYSIVRAGSKCSRANVECATINLHKISEYFLPFMRCSREACATVPMKLATASFSREAVLLDPLARLHSVYIEWP